MPAVTPVSNPHGGEPMSMVNPNRHPLRRAVYVHVSDLISSYNIDHARLEEQLTKVKEERERTEVSTPARLGGVPTELDTTFPQKRLQPPRGGYNLCVLVGKVKVVVDKNRVDGSRVRLAEVDVGDETGTVSLRARDDQIDTLEEVSKRNGAVVLRNCTLELYQGKHIRLAVTKWGKLNPYPDNVVSTPPPPTKINIDRNFAMIDLSLVASEMEAYSQGDAYQAAAVESPTQQHPSSGQYSMHQQQMYSHNRRGGSRRQPHRPKPVQQHYTDRYPGGLHGYGTGFDGRMDSPSFSYNLRSSPEAAQQQQMMMQHQFEMQQRHIHQMYHPSTSNPHQPDRSSSGQPSSPMISSGVPSPGSFDAYSPQEVHLQSGMTGVNRFHQHQQQHQQRQQAKLQGGYSTPSNTAGHQSSSSDGSPASPTMNPQAATFDPSSTPQGHYHSNRLSER